MLFTKYDWIEFNLYCIEKDLGIRLSPKEFYNETEAENNFFNVLELYKSFEKKAFRVDVEEGLEKCPICSGSKILSEQVQKRSADEGMTNVHKCSECNWKWEN
jgi:DNA-directed RNA polymerase subunit M/transcription elongation factor TFIIS